MDCKFHSYQKTAKDFILNNNSAALFLDMGLGKTLITLTAIKALKFDYFDVCKVLVVAPLRVAQDTWSRELEKWDHLKGLKMSLVLGTEKARFKGLAADADIYVINRENVPWLVKFYEGQPWPFDMVIIDELSSFKSRASQRFKALRKVRPYINRIVGLTGTPAPNSLMDLWPQIYLLDRGERLGKTLSAYRDAYFHPAQMDRSRKIVYSWALDPGAEDIIYGKLSDICISMTANDWLDLPARTDIKTPVTLSKEQMKKYRSLERELFLDLKGSVITASNAAVVTGKLQQYAQGAIYNEAGGWSEIHDAKLLALGGLIEEAQEKPILVFYWFKHDLARIKALYPEARELKDTEDIDDWNAGKIKLLLAHPASAGHGLNLQAGGNIIVWFSLTWSLELYQQANARLHRQGQEQKVIVYHLIAEKTIDEDIMLALEGKAEGQSALMDAVKARINI